MSEISAKEFGNLQSDVKHLTQTMDNHTVILERVDAKLDGVVTQEQFAKRITESDAKFENHSMRISAIEDRFKISDSSVWKKIAKSIEDNLIKIVASGIVLFIVIATFVLVQQNLATRKDITEEIKQQLRAIDE